MEAVPGEQKGGDMNYNATKYDLMWSVVLIVLIAIVFMGIGRFTVLMGG